MKKQGILSIFLSIVLFAQIFTLDAAGSSIAKARVETNERMKGIWVSTVANLDYPLKQTTDSDYLKSEADKIIINCEDMGFNAIFLQVRPTSDALYKSNIFPWSKYLTGSQGTAPSDGFDPLEYFVTECHKKGIELHAWINPYRATNDGNSASIANLANMNPAKQHPEYVIKYSNGNYYYDPAIPEVRQLLVDGVMEIVNNYDIDGIHMDDYFYPGQNFDDSESYKTYGNGQDKGDWRRENVNTLIKQIHDTIQDSGKDVAFGISPSGVWANKDNNPLGSNTRGSESYYNLYADTRKWAREEWIDYICPQIYWEVGHSHADYETLVKWWSDAVGKADTKLYIGLADYRVDGAGSSSVWYNGKEIKKQLTMNKQSAPRVSGEVHFRYRNFIDNPELYIMVREENGGGDSNNSNSSQTVEVTTSIEKTTETTTLSKDNAETKPVFDPDKIVNNDPNKILVYVDGKRIDFDQDPVLKNDRALVPFRKIFESLGADVEWDNDSQHVKAVLGDNQIDLTIGQDVMFVNLVNTIKLDTPPEIIKSRTMVPLRAISESLGLDVEWHNDNRVITINS